MTTSTGIRRRRRPVLRTLLAVALLVAPAAQARHQTITGAPTPRSKDVPVVVVKSNDTFDWADAGVGAGTAVGIALVGGAAAVAFIRRRRVRAAH
jgi:hypothetical protein